MRTAVQPQQRAIVCIYNAAPGIKISYCMGYSALVSIWKTRQSERPSPLREACFPALQYSVCSPSRWHRRPGKMAARYSKTTSDSDSPPTCILLLLPIRARTAAAFPRATVKPEVISLSFPGRDRPGPEKQPGCTAAELQHHRGPGREMERTERASSERNGRSERQCSAGQSGGSRAAVPWISDHSRSLRIYRCPGVPQPVDPEPESAEPAARGGGGRTSRAIQLQGCSRMVVLATGNAYLQALSGAARLETAEAQLQTAQALLWQGDRSAERRPQPGDRHLRAQVEFQNRQQQLIVASNEFAKQKLALVRAIGLPTGQEIALIQGRRTMAWPRLVLRRACSAPMRPARIIWRPRNRSAPQSTIARARPRNTFPLSI